jgi:hypothetical protein
MMEKTKRIMIRALDEVLVKKKPLTNKEFKRMLEKVIVDLKRK